MILVADIGNSEIDFGLFEEPSISHHFSKQACVAETSDEIGLFVMQMLKQRRVAPGKIQGMAICSVVPELNRAVSSMGADLFGRQPFLVTHQAKMPIKLRVDHPQEVGSDRIVNASAAYQKYGGPLLVIDSGTATTFNVVTSKGWFLGGAILPGLQAMKRSLVAGTSKLPSFEFDLPDRFIGQNTQDALKSGFINGYIGSLRYLTEGIKQEIQAPKLKVLATGGLSGFLGQWCPWIHAVEPTLTLEGAGLLYQLNA